MRWTWVSAGTIGASKQKHMTQAAVFGPTPSIAVRKAIPSSSGTPPSHSRSDPRGSPAIWSSTRWMRGAFWLARPATRTASSTSSTGAARTASQVGNRSRRLRNARSWFTSVVEWLKSVVTSSLTGSWRRAYGSGPWSSASRRTIASTWARVPGRGVAIAIAATLRGTPGPRPRVRRA